MSNTLEKLFDTRQTPTAKDYFDDNGEILVDFFLRKNTYNFIHGMKFDIYIRPKNKIKSKKIRKDPYIKFLEKRTYYRVASRLENKNNVDEPKIVTKISFAIDPNSYDAKLLLIIHNAVQSHLINYYISKQDDNGFSDKKRHIRKYMKAVDKYISLNNIKINGLINYGSFCDKVPAINILPECKSCCPGISTLSSIMSEGGSQDDINDNNQNFKNWILNKINIPLLKRREGGKKGNIVYEKNPNVRTRGPYGVQFCNYTLKRSMMRSRAKYEKYKSKHPKKTDRIKSLHDDYMDYKREFNDDNNEDWDADTLNIKIPPTTLLKYVGVRCETCFLNKSSMWVDMQLTAKHVWYTNDVEDQGNPDGDSDYCVSDSDDDNDESEEFANVEEPLDD
jgi:hypothetical protein